MSFYNILLPEMAARKVLTLSILLAALFSLPNAALAQNMSVNSTGAEPDSTAMLDVSSSSKGMLIPRMTASEVLGITNPANGLMIYQTDGNPGLYIYDNTGGAWDQVMDSTGVAGLISSSSDIAAVLSNGRDASNDTIQNLGAISNPGTFTVITSDGSANLYTFTSNGHLGIGLDTSNYELQIHEPSGSLSAMQITSSSTGSSVSDGFQIGINQDTAVVMNAENGPLLFGTNSVTSMTLNSNGDLSLGTDSAFGDAKFAILENTSGYTGMYVVSGATGRPFYGYSLDGALTGWTYVDGTNNSEWKVYLNGQDRLTIQQDGDAGVGTTSPEYRLDVAGPIRSGLEGTNGQLRLYSEQGSTDFEAVFNPSSAMVANTEYTLPPDDGDANEVLTSDGSGNLSWASASSSTTELSDNDGNTKIQVEETTNDDLIRFDIANTEVMRVGALGRIQIFNANATVMLGNAAGNALSTGTQNVFVGYEAGNSTSSSSNSTFIGYQAGKVANATGNTVVGSFSGDAISSGTYNTMLGLQSGSATNTGGDNVFIGKNAGRINSSGSHNTFIGTGAGDANNGDHNVFIGYLAGSAEASASDRLYIDNSNAVRPLIWGDFDADSLVFNGLLTLDEDKDGTGFTFPGSDGTSGQVLQTNGSGTVTWEDAAQDNDWTISNSIMFNTTERFGFGTSALPGSYFSEIETPTAGTYTVGLSIDHNYNGAAQQFGLVLNLSNASTGEKYGIYNTVTGNSSQANPIYGTLNSVKGADTESAFGTANFVEANGSGSGFGALNNVSAAAGNPSTQYGSSTTLSNNGTGISFGSMTLVSAAASNTSDQNGSSITISNSGTGASYGSVYSITAASGSNAADQYGSKTTLTNTGSGIVYGNSYTISNIGTGARFGSFLDISSPSGNADSTVGVYQRMNVAGSGNAHGTYVDYSQATGTGKHYGFYSTGEDRNYFSGNVGIGTPSPSYKLSVLTGTSEYGIEHTDGTISLASYVDNTGAWFGTVTNHPLFLFTDDGNPELSIDVSGNVSIGNNHTTATSKLDVAGDIEVGDSNDFYFGDPTTDGTWRITRDGNNLVFERRESGVWVTKTAMTP